MITISILYENIRTRALDAHAFITVGHFKVVQMAIVVADQVYSVSSADIRTTANCLSTNSWNDQDLHLPNGNIKHIKVCNVIENQVESRRIHKNQIMNGDVSRGDEADQACILPGAVSTSNVTLAVDRAFIIARKDFDILGVLDDNSIAVERSIRGQSDLTVDLESPTAAFIEVRTSGH